jgi:hypothetical protein
MKNLAFWILLALPMAIFAEGYPGRFALHPEKYRITDSEVYAYYVSLPWDHALAEVYVIEYRGTEVTKGKRIDIRCGQHPPSKTEVDCPLREEKVTELSAETARAVIACFRELDFASPSDSAKEGLNVVIPDDIGVEVTIIDFSGGHSASFGFGDSRQIRSFNRRIDEIRGHSP